MAGGGGGGWATVHGTPDKLELDGSGESGEGKREGRAPPGEAPPPWQNTA